MEANNFQNMIQHLYSLFKTNLRQTTRIILESFYVPWRRVEYTIFTINFPVSVRFFFNFVKQLFQCVLS